MKLNKVILQAVLCCFLLTALHSCTGKGERKGGGSRTEYYRNLRISQTPYDTEKGIHPLSASESKSINSYRFSYDDSGRLSSVQFVRNNMLLNYSAMGFAAKITYEYSDGKQNKFFFNENNEAIESAGVFREEYQLDANGHRTGLKYFGQYGEPVENRHKIHSYHWDLLADGMVRELRYDLYGAETVINPFCPFYELRFTYNAEGFLTRMANYKADTLYNCTAENCGDVGVSYFNFEPNKSGDVEVTSVYNATGLTSNVYWGWSKRINTFDENGNMLQTVLLDQDGEPLGGKKIPVMQFDYDEHGAVVEIRNLDSDKKPMNKAENKVSVTRYTYDQLGTRTETLRFDKDGNPLNMRFDIANCCCF